MRAQVLGSRGEAATATIPVPEATTVPGGPGPKALRCAYVDADVWGWRQLAAVHEELARASLPASSRSFVLNTCERVEVYATNSAALAPILGAMPGEITDWVGVDERVRRRLTEIAAGVRSRLLGERLVLRQVERVAFRLPDRHVLLGVLREAVEIARVVRERHGFVADTDYPDLAGALLSPDGRDRDGLLVVGSGMLAGAVVRRAHAAGRRPIVMVSRQPKHARRRSPVPPPTVVTGGASSARRLLGHRPYGVVLATTNLTGRYREHVAELVRDPRCFGVVDLCSVPVRLDGLGGTRYVHLHSPEFVALLQRQNDRLAARALLVRRDIAAVYGGPG